MIDDPDLIRAQCLLDESRHTRRLSLEKPPCPKCGATSSRVVDTKGVKRRRECRECRYRWNTWEINEHAA